MLSTIALLSTIATAAPAALLSALSYLSSPRLWFQSFVRSSILNFLEHAIQEGYLELTDGSETFRFGTHTNAANAVYVSVTHPNFWHRVFSSGDLGFSEAYMMGEVDVSDDNLKGVMDLWLDNEARMNGLSSIVHRITTALSGLTNAFLGQTLSRARLNAVASYDQSNELFKSFLSQEMMYSCALWGPIEGGPRGDIDPVLPSPVSPGSSTSTLVSAPDVTSIDDALERAQARKVAHVLDQLRLRPGARVLEVGAGWGALAITAAREYGAEVDTLTLSVEQQRLAEERVGEAGLEGRVRVHLMDYREIPRDWDGLFDAFVSIEMLEHVGAAHYNEYFAIIDRTLKSAGATAVVSSSTFPESRYTSYQADDFMRRYMWPNSSLPSASVLIGAAQKGAGGRLALQRVENHAVHYPRTLREWDRRLDARLEPAALGLAPTYAPAATRGLKARGLFEEKALPLEGPSREQAERTLLQALPDHGADDFGAIRRKWKYLFAYAAAGFQKGYIACHMLTFARGSDIPEGC